MTPLTRETSVSSLEDRVARRIAIDVIIPVYNEEKILPQSIGTLVGFLREHIREPYRVLITDNASIDRTEEVARRLAEQYEEVEYLRLP